MSHRKASKLVPDTTLTQLAQLAANAAADHPEVTHVQLKLRPDVHDHLNLPWQTCHDSCTKHNRRLHNPRGTNHCTTYQIQVQDPDEIGISVYTLNSRQTSGRPTRARPQQVLLANQTAWLLPDDLDPDMADVYQRMRADGIPPTDAQAALNTAVTTGTPTQ